MIDLTKISFIQKLLRKDTPKIKVGDVVRVYEKIKEDDKERISLFEGIVIAKKHGKGLDASFTVRGERKGGYWVEKTYPLHSPLIDKIKVIRHKKVRRAKLYYLRKSK